MTDPAGERPEAEDVPEDAPIPDEDDDEEPRWGGEESLGMLPPD